MWRVSYEPATSARHESVFHDRMSRLLLVFFGGGLCDTLAANAERVPLSAVRVCARARRRDSYFGSS